MLFEIRHAKNGLVLKVTDKYDEGPKEIVFQEKYDDEEDVECFADFLRLLDDQFGPSTSRYSPKRIYVRVEPGDKYEGPA